MLTCGMSRSALVLSIGLHAAVLGVVGWSSASIVSHAGLGKTEIGVAFSPEDAGGLVVADPPAATPAAQITPPAVEISIAPPVATIDIHPMPLAAVDPVPPPITTVTVLPREVPSVVPPKTKTRAGARAMTGTAGRMQATASNAGSGVNDGGAMGLSRGGGGGPGYVPPQFLMRYKPPYPDEARAQKIEGTVLLLVSVDASGRVVSAQLSRGCAHEVLDRAALAAVRAWRFVPAHQGDQAVSATVEVPIRFHYAERG